MDIYVYVDNSLIAGDDAIINISLSESDSYTYEEDNELIKYCEKHKRVNIEVKSGFNNNQFSPKMKELLHKVQLQKIQKLLQSFYSIYHNGEGNVYLGSNGKITKITDLFR